MNDLQTFVPPECQHCHAAWPATPEPDDPPAMRAQTIELPLVVATVTEYKGRPAPVRSAARRAGPPFRALTAHRIGPRLTAALSYLAEVSLKRTVLVPVPGRA